MSNDKMFTRLLQKNSLKKTDDIIVEYLNSNLFIVKFVYCKAFLNTILRYGHSDMAYKSYKL